MLDWRIVANGRMCLVLGVLATALAISHSASTHNRVRRNLVPYSGVKSSLRRYRYPIYSKRELDLVNGIGTDCNHLQFRKRFLGGSRLATLNSERHALMQPHMVPDLDDLAHVLRLYESGKRSETTPGQGQHFSGPWLLDSGSDGDEDIEHDQQELEPSSGTWHELSQYEEPQFSTQWQHGTIPQDRIVAVKKNSEDPYLFWQAAHLAEVGKRSQSTDDLKPDSSATPPESLNPPLERQARAFDDVFGWDKRKKNSENPIQTDLYLNTIRKALSNSGFTDEEHPIKKSQTENM